ASLHGLHSCRPTRIGRTGRAMSKARDAVRVAPQAIASCGLIVLICLFPGPWNRLRYLGLTLTTLAAIPFQVARYQLADSFSVNPQARTLVTTGICSRIRNPMYTFSTLMILGAVIAYQRAVLLLVPAALVLVQQARARRESRVLEAAFGESYRQYQE